MTLCYMTLALTLSAADSCKPGPDWEEMTRASLLAKADFVFKGRDKDHFNVTENGEVIVKAKFEVECVFKTTPPGRNITSEIIISRVRNRTSCSWTHISPGDEVYIALRELKCVTANSECDFEFHEVNAPQVAAFAVSDKFTWQITKTCGLIDYRPPKYCVITNKTKNLCPVSDYVGNCLPASATKTPLSTPIVLMIVLFSSIFK